MKKKKGEFMSKTGKAGRIRTISFKDIDLNDSQFNMRNDKEKISKDLMKSIKKDGQISPIYVRPSPTKKEKYQIISGFMRARALTNLKQNIKATIFNTITDDHAMQIAMLENTLRKTIDEIKD